MKEFSVRKGVVISRKGVPGEPRWFCDGRLGFEFGAHGISRVHYMYDSRTVSSHVLFFQRNWDGFRIYVEKDHLTYQPEYGACRIWPYGIETEWNFQDTRLKLGIYAVSESIVLRLETPASLPAGLRFKLEFYDLFALTPVDGADIRMSKRDAERAWKDWQFRAGGNTLLGGFSDLPDDGSRGADVNVAITAGFRLQYHGSGINTKRVLRSGELEAGSSYAFLIDFCCGDGALKHARSKLAALPDLIERQKKRYERVSEKSPTLDSPYRLLNDFMSLAPAYHESLKVPDIPGAIRAGSASYWVWGWDGMTSNDATAYWGDLDHIEGMLELYERSADPAEGIAHAFRHDMSVSSISALPAQGMYVCLLQHFFSMTGDLGTVRRHYGFARKTFERIASMESGDTGFCKGTSLFPDFPRFMKETGNDLSTFNNTVWYCSARSMEYLASLVDDEATGAHARRLSRTMERTFAKLFFDRRRKFIVSSIDSETHRQRESYNLGSLKWENSYLSELLEPVWDRCVGFIAENSISPAGLREIPVWSEAYDGDANQLHCWWPVNSEFFIRTAIEHNRADWIERFIGYIEHWTRRLSCPEGISYSIETDDPDMDRWNTMSGAWQAYSIRGWYQAVIHGVLGMDIDAGGITFHPHDGDEMTLKGLPFHGRVLDIGIRGSGGFISRIEVDGSIVKATWKLPIDSLGSGKRVTILVHRTRRRPVNAFIRRATGLELRSFRSGNGIMRAQIRGEGTCRIRIGAERKPVVRVDGSPTRVLYDAALHSATVEVAIRHSEERTLEIQ